MPLVTMRQILDHAAENSYGVPAFNINDMEQVIAVLQAARKVNAHGYPYVEAVRPADCIGCASCGIVCPDGCITVYRKRITVADPVTDEQNTK